jgi:hypothetical protein
LLRTGVWGRHLPTSPSFAVRQILTGDDGE